MKNGEFDKLLNEFAYEAVKTAKNREFFNEFKEKLAKACKAIGGEFVRASKGAVCRKEYAIQNEGNTKYGVTVVLDNTHRINNKPTVNILIKSIHTEKGKELNHMTVPHGGYGIGVPKSIEGMEDLKTMKIETEDGTEAVIFEETLGGEFEEEKRCTHLFQKTVGECLVV